MTIDNPKQVLSQIPRPTLTKWVLFLVVVYALFDAVTLFADSKRLMIDMADVTGGLVPILALHIDVPLLIGTVLVCLIFDRRQMFSALALRSKGQMLWMVVGALIFVVAVYLKEPVSAVDVYEILHALIIAGFVEELLFRGLFFFWLDKAGCGQWAYLFSGLAWGASFGIRAIVVSGTSTLFAVVPMAIFGMVVGTIIALIYKKSDSLWLVVYIHAIFSLI